jgi:hypothetical protein
MTRALVVLATLLLVGTATAHADPQPVEQGAASPETVLDLPRAWEVSQGAGVVVAVVDSGVRLSHPDLAPNLWRNPAEIPGNRRDDDGNGYVDDIHGVDLTGERSLDDGQSHGTHVAGTIATAQNRKGVVGVAYKAKLMTVRILDARGAGTTKMLAEGIRYAAANGARIINLKGRTLLAEGLSAQGRRIASATARVGGASPAPPTIALSGSTPAGAAVAEVLDARPHATRFTLVGGGTEMGLADAARGDRRRRPRRPPAGPLRPTGPHLHAAGRQHDSGLRHTRRASAGSGPHPALDRGLRDPLTATFMTAYGRAAHRARDPGRQSSLPRRGGRNIRLQVGDLVR